MSEKMPSLEAKKSPFKLFHLEWLKKAREKFKDKPESHLFAGGAAAAIGSGILMALGLLNPISLVIGAGTMMGVAYLDYRKKKPAAKKPEKKSEKKSKEK